MKGTRLDIYLYLNGFAESREKAKRLIKNNSVYVNNLLANKPSILIHENCNVMVTDVFDYVGRGAIKLEKAINVFKIDPQNKICIDVGASTGGFTDYLLRHGAKKVYAIDVGHDQLHNKLKSDIRVINLENVNIRYIDSKVFDESIDIIVVDVSFISLRLILPKIVEISQNSTHIVVLVKPQFEAGIKNIGKNGIVKNEKVHLTVLNNFTDYCKDNSLNILNITYSPIKGGNGNIEYLAFLRKEPFRVNNINYKALIKEAFDLL